MTLAPATAAKLGEAVARGVERVAALLPIVGADSEPSWSIEARLSDGRAYRITVVPVD